MGALCLDRAGCSCRSSSVPYITNASPPSLPLHSMRPPVLARLSTTLFRGLLVSGLASGLASQIYRYRRVSNAAQRQQTKWVVFGGALAIIGFIVALALGMLY